MRKENTEKVVYTDFNQLPLTLTPKDIKDILGISKNNAYALCNSKDFPAVRIGKLIRINRDRFIEWYNTATMVELSA